jgi:hypothetical protein
MSLCSIQALVLVIRQRLSALKRTKILVEIWETDRRKPAAQDQKQIAKFLEGTGWRRGSESNEVRGFFQNPLLRNYHPTTRGEQPHN